MQLLNVYNHDHDDIDEVEDDPDDDDNQENNKYDDDGDDSSSQNEIQDEVDQESKYSYNDDYDHEEEDDPGEALFSGRINPYTTNSSSSSSRPVTTKVFKPARITDYFPVIPSSKRSTSTPTSKQPRNIPSHKKSKPQTTIRPAPTSEKNIKRQKKED